LEYSQASDRPAAPARRNKAITARCPAPRKYFAARNPSNRCSLSSELRGEPPRIARAEGNLGIFAEEDTARLFPLRAADTFSAHGPFAAAGSEVGLVSNVSAKAYSAAPKFFHALHKLT
jgi:hypothetical protein